MIGPTDMEKGSSLVGYWVIYVTLTFGLTHDFDLEFFSVKFLNFQEL